MRVAVLCEFSGIVRDAFIARGHEAISCDLEPTEKPGPHIQGDCRDYDWRDYDLVIAHPPCTYLSSVGNRALKENPKRFIDRQKALAFFLWCYYLPNKYICVENPVGYINSAFRQPDQIIHPFYFGDSELKRTCLWLRRLPPLIHAQQEELFLNKTHINVENKVFHKSGKSVGKPVHFVERMNWMPKNERAKYRSKTFPGIAAAMAEQWGSL